MVCQRLSAMQEQARLGEFRVQNSLSAPTQVYEKCGVRPPEYPTPSPCHTIKTKACWLKYCMSLFQERYTYRLMVYSQLTGRLWLVCHYIRGT